MVWLKKRFCTPIEADKEYPCLVPKVANTSTQTACLKSQNKGVQVNTTVTSVSTQTDNNPLPRNVLSSLDQKEQLQSLSNLFSQWCSGVLQCVVPKDFLVHCSQAFQRLSSVKRSNVLYSLAKGIGTMRTDKRESLFPVTRMPMGLLEFMVNFFIADDS